MRSCLPLKMGNTTPKRVDHRPWHNPFKYADDMVIVGLLKHNDPDHSYFNTITRFTTWCQASNLMLSTDKAKEMVFDFCRTYDITSNVFIDNKPIAKVLEFKYLGISFSHDLKWQANSDSLYKKLKSRFSQSLNHSSRP